MSNLIAGGIRIGGVIRTAGPCEAVHNGWTNALVARMQDSARHEAQGDGILRDVLRHSRNRKNAQLLAELKREERMPLRRRIAEWAVTAWCVLYAWCEELGLLKYEEDDAPDDADGMD